MNSELRDRLKAIAYAKSYPFCYGCYARATKGKCAKCHSDDLMRELPGVGVEYGTDWVIESLIRSELTPIDTGEAFEQSLEGCYPETTKVGFMELDTITVMKEMDPICFRMAESEYIDSLLEDEQVITFDNGSTYYWAHDVENFCDENESEVAS